MGLDRWAFEDLSDHGMKCIILYHMEQLLVTFASTIFFPVVLSKFIFIVETQMLL